MRAALTALLLATLAAGALAQRVPDDLQGLRGERGERVERTERRLEDRGFRRVHDMRERDRAWEYWWSRRDDECLLLATAGGRVRSLDAVSETDCVREGSDPRRVSAAGRTAREAARRAGVESLAHRTHERAGRFDDAREIADFERGYRDAAAGRPEDRRARPAAYTAGFRVGGDGRGGSERPPVVGAGPELPSGVVRSPDALVGTRESQLERQMTANGFQQLTRARIKRESFATWQNRANQQCYKTVARDGIVTSVVLGNEMDCR